MKRSLSLFNLSFHTLQHIQYSFENIYNSPMIPVTKSFLKIMDWTDKSLSKLPSLNLCFSGNTLININNSLIKIKYIKPGFIINNNKIIAVHKFKYISSNDMYIYNKVIVSGSHLVKENNTWINISDSKFSHPITFNKYLYCLSTKTGNILINKTIFKDYSESRNILLNNYINNLIINILNKNQLHKYIYSNDKYFKQGIYGNIKIKTKNGYKLIKNIKINDKLVNGIVLGNIKILSKYLDMYLYKNKYIFSGNIIVYENNKWIKCKNSSYSKKIKYKFKYASFNND